MNSTTDVSLINSDAFYIPDTLNGKNGSNRAIGNRPQIVATTDIEALHAWLSRFIDTKTTFDNYRKEAERLLLWATSYLKKPLSSLSHEDMLAYQNFIKNPQPEVVWVMPNKTKVARSHPTWKPFSGPLSSTSQRQCVIILNTMFSWLVNAGYLAGNPLALSRTKTRKTQSRVTRYLDDALWQDVKKSIKDLPKTNKREIEHAIRSKWLFSLLYSTGLRISEVCNNTMGCFFNRKDNAGLQRWWLEVVGKGNKKRIIPVTSELMHELSYYRVYYKLPPEPFENELVPLFLPIGGRHQTMGRSAIHTVVKNVFKDAADFYRNKGSEYEVIALKLESASTHWLRHTAGSHMANMHMDLRHVRDNLGHESMTTTSGYLHSSDDIRHSETEKYHKINW